MANFVINSCLYKEIFDTGGKFIFLEDFFVTVLQFGVMNIDLEKKIGYLIHRHYFSPVGLL
jgi:hypothetical protein